MKKPDYLPTHEHFYAWVAENKENLKPFLEDVDSIKKDFSISNTDYPIVENDRLCYSTKVNGYKDKLLLKSEIEPIDLTEKKESERVKDLDIENVEFESKSSESDKYSTRWWDIEIKTSLPKYKLTSYALIKGYYVKPEFNSYVSFDIHNFNIVNKHWEEQKDDLTSYISKVRNKYLENHAYRDFDINIEDFLGKCETYIERNGKYEKSVNFRGGNEQFVNIEYKTSIEESTMDKLLRQVKKRNNNKQVVRAVVSFDPRFENYRSLLENEGLELFIYGEEYRKELANKFSKKSVKNNLSDFS